MADDLGSSAPVGIAALPPTTVRQIGSHQLLTDPSSVVKEMIDNALDARAKSVFVDITANTIDTIQVKDDGHGIPGEDRALACRRYCTSKIRDFHDLKEIGGKWLGFRGEALASIADMCGTVSIITRVEGEPVAVKLNYQRNGELIMTERESHPVGTTVKVSKVLETARVRKDLAIKGAAKCLAKIRRLMQAYALARPAVRFRLRILKAKNNKGDFVYAPKSNANVEDATLKIFGKECALQCDWSTLELDGFKLHAFMPKPAAVGTKNANYGAFISVDFRPLSSARGTLKKIAATVRERLRKADSALAAVKDPFFYLNITCPVDSYDPNIEPAKDDVVFGDEKSVLALLDRLLVAYYPGNANYTQSVGISEDAVATHPHLTHEVAESSLQSHTPNLRHHGTPTENTQVIDSESHNQQPRWRSNMYAIDEEDLQFLRRNTPDMVEEEEVQSDPTMSNPWTIARMNVPVKPRKPVSNGQLLSPAKTQGDISAALQSPVHAATPRQLKSAELATPVATPRANTDSHRLDEELEQSVQGFSGPVFRDISMPIQHTISSIERAHGLPSLGARMSSTFLQPGPHLSPADSSIQDSSPTRRKARPRSTFRDKPYGPPSSQVEHTWFGQHMHNATRATRLQKRSRQQTGSFLPKDDTLASQRSLVLPAAERLIASRPVPEDNTTIRNFFNPRRKPAAATTSQSPQTAASSPPRRPRSANSYHHSAQEMTALFQLHQFPASDPDSSATRSTRPHRRRTTEASLHRTKSSSLPLKFTPRGFETHNLALPIMTSVTSIIQLARRLDMGGNTPEWGCESNDAVDVFATPITEQMIMQWVIRVDDLLGDVYERRDGVEVIGALHEGIQRFLDARREGEEASERAGVDGDASLRHVVGCGGEGSLDGGNTNAEGEEKDGVGEQGDIEGGEDEMLMDP